MDVSPLAAADPSSALTLPVNRESRLSVTEFTSNAKALPPHPVQALQENVSGPSYRSLMKTYLARSAGIRATAGCNWKDFRHSHAPASQYGTPCSLSAATVLVWCISCDINLLRRLPGLPNHYVGLETMLGIDEDLDVEDVLSGTSIQ